MRFRNAHRAVAVGLALAFTAAACGSDSGEEAASTTAAGATSTAAGAGAGKADDPASWGVANKKLTGPAGFTVDLAQCQGNWSETAGVTDTEIRLGQVFVLSGAAAAYGAIATGVKNYFDYVNETEGGVGGKKLVHILKDDGYEAARAKAGVDEILETQNPFAFFTGSGSPTMLATYDKLNERCIPYVMTGAGHPATGDPVNHPWTTGSILAYSTEANIWGKYILDTLGKGATVAALVINNDFGLAMKNSFEKYAKANGLNLVKAELYDPSAPTMTNELTTLSSTNADVMISMTNGPGCTASFKHLADGSWKPKLKIASATCSPISSVFKPAGEGGRDWVLAVSAKELTDPAMAADPAVKLVKDQLTKAGLDPNNSNHLSGWWFSMPVVEMLKMASKMKGGLTRSNLILAARSIDWKHPLNRDGVGFRQHGLDDAYYIEAAQLTKYEIAPGQDIGSFKTFGSVINVEGTSGLCAWDGKACR